MKTILNVFLTLGFALPLTLQAKENYFRFPYPGKEKISHITRVVSIDIVKEGWVYAYASDEDMKSFQIFGIDSEPLPHPGSTSSIECIDSADSRAWSSYPSHPAYITMMKNFSTNYPDICKFETIGQSSSGRTLAAVKLSSSKSVITAKPEVFLSSTLHGDETAGYILLLRLTDFLTSKYGQNSDEGLRVTKILDNCDLYINPLANPDGTYGKNDHSITNATRSNAKGVDLNRNFPDPFGSSHPDGKDTQVETKAFLDFAHRHHFALAANLHGGSELVNYPWDSIKKRHSDDAWWQAVGRRYADLAQKSGPANYFKDEKNGITNGYDWYEIRGGRQDYMNSVLGCREATIEVSSIKLLPPESLEAYWNYNKESLLNYLEESQKGIRGTVINAITGKAIPEAKVSLSIPDEIPVSCNTNGAFFRFVLPGTYTVNAEAKGYQRASVAQIVVTASAPTVANIQLQPD